MVITPPGAGILFKSPPQPGQQIPITAFLISNLSRLLISMIEYHNMANEIIMDE